MLLPQTFADRDDAFAALDAEYKNGTLAPVFLFQAPNETTVRLYMPLGHNEGQLSHVVRHLHDEHGDGTVFLAYPDDARRDVSLIELPLLHALRIIGGTSPGLGVFDDALHAQLYALVNVWYVRFPHYVIASGGRFAVFSTEERASEMLTRMLERGDVIESTHVARASGHYALTYQPVAYQPKVETRYVFD